MTTTTPPHTAGRPALDAPAVPEAPPAVEARRSTAARGRADVIIIIGAAVAALSLAALLVTRMVPTSNLAVFVVIAYLLFLPLYGVLVSLEDDGRTVRDRIASVAVHSLAVLALLALVLIIVFTFFRGEPVLVHLNLYIHDMQKTGPLDPLTSGGIVHAEAGTLIEIAIALLITVPLGLTCAVFLNEVRGVFPRVVRTVAEAMTALPSIVVGLFILALWILTLGFPQSGLAAALAISVMMFPIMIRASDVVLRLVPGSLKEASYAMGAPRWRTVWHVVLPTARSGLTTSLLLATARGIGETSPVLLTAGYGNSLNLNPFSGPMVSLPLFTFISANSPQKTMVDRAFGAATVLLVLVLVLFALARVLGGRQAGELSTRVQRRRAQESLRDLERFVSRDRTPKRMGAQMGGGHGG
ncbi:MAG: phosphate ABC transporter permease PstA [Pseudonocardiales bacterium]|nr:phosphate ABC transporter permease PstA [Pseudonocardiales bacterium]MBV9032608.1 phosphate ABC transporter permease PstA [Pseudonocardiales bacterium]